MDDKWENPWKIHLEMDDKWENPRKIHLEMDDKWENPWKIHLEMDDKWGKFPMTLEPPYPNDWVWTYEHM